jgi:Predicted membrane protein
MSWLVPIAGLSVLAAAIAYVAGIHAARRLGPKLSSFVGLTEVLFAVLFAWVLLGQLPSLEQGIGAVLIIAGIVLVRLDESEQAPEQPIDLAESVGTASERQSNQRDRPVVLAPELSWVKSVTTWR